MMGEVVFSPSCDGVRRRRCAVQVASFLWSLRRPAVETACG